MITEASIEALKMLKSREISRQAILDCGFKKDDIKVLIDRGIIERVRRGIYQVISKKQEESIEGKFKRCLNLLENASIEEAKELFLECLNDNSKYMDELFKLVLESFQNKNYEKVFLYFELVLASNSDAHIREVKYYLCLLNYFTDIPFEYKKLIKDLKYEDVEIPKGSDIQSDGDGDEITTKKNKRREQLFKKGYVYSVFIKEPTIYESIEHILIMRRSDSVQNRNTQLNELLTKKDYKAIEEHLEQESQKRVLPPKLEASRIIVKHLEASQNGILPDFTTHEGAEDYCEAIKNGNFTLALKLLGNTSSTDILRVLLENLLSQKEVSDKFTNCLDLLETESLEEAKNLFLECISTNSIYIDKLLNLIYDAIDVSDYKKVFLYFELLLATNDERYKKDVLFWLYLLDYLTDIPIEYITRIKLFQFEEVQVANDDSRYSDYSMQNTVRFEALVEKKFGFRNLSALTIAEKITKKLLGKCGEKKQIYHKKIHKAIRAKEHSRAFDSLDFRKKYYGLSQKEELIWLLLKRILSVKSGHIDFNISFGGQEKYWDAAIRRGDFNLAMKLLEEKGNTNYVEYLLLQDLVRILDEREKIQKFEECIENINNDALETTKKLFLECLTFDNECIDRLFMLIIKTLKNKDYEKVFLYFELILDSNNETYIREVKFYLYLLNYLTNVPEHFLKHINNLQYGYIRVKEFDTRFSDITVINNIRESALCGQRYIPDEGCEQTEFDKINLELWEEYSKKVRTSHQVLFGFITMGDYDNFLESIELESQRRNLSKGLLMVKDLVKYILDIKKGIFPKSSTEAVDNEYDAVKIGNFQLAYDLRKKRKEAEEPIRKGDMPLALLTEIINLLNEKTENIETNRENIPNASIVLIFSDPNESVESLLNKINEYLCKINKSEYSFLFASLLKICVQSKEKDNRDFSLVIATLSELTEGIFIYDPKIYEDAFYNAIEKTKLDSARCYFDIINGFVGLGIFPNTPLAVLGNELYNAHASKSLTDKTKAEDYYYGIENAQDLMMTIEAGGLKLGVNKACRNLGLDSETINLLKLIYAKNYYCCGYIEQGDDFLQSVEKSKDKSEKVKQELRKVRKNRLLYQNFGPQIDITKIKLLRP